MQFVDMLVEHFVHIQMAHYRRCLLAFCIACIGRCGAIMNMLARSFTFLLDYLSKWWHSCFTLAPFPVFYLIGQGSVCVWGVCSYRVCQFAHRVTNRSTHTMRTYTYTNSHIDVDRERKREISIL